MKICMVSMHGCIRVFKQAYVLQKLGHEVHHCAMRTSFGYEKYHTFSLYNTEAEGIRLIKHMARTCDIFHVHNEPDWIVSMVRKATGKPIIYDVHDLEHVRTGEPPDEHESRAFQDCDGIVHTTEATKASAEAAHDIKNKPNCVLPPAVPADFLPSDQIANNCCWGTLVYEGGISAYEMTPSSNGGKPMPSFRYYLPIIKPFLKAGYQPYFYAGNPTDAGAYEHEGAVVYGHLPWNVMMRALPMFEIGFVGAVVDSPIMQQSISNKFFEYVACGVVPVICLSGQASAFANQFDLAIDLDVNKGPESISRHEVVKKKQNLMAVRKDIVMENYITKVVNLYKAVM